MSLTDRIITGLTRNENGMNTKTAPVSPVSVWKQWIASDRLVLIACLCAIPAGVLLSGV